MKSLDISTMALRVSILTFLTVLAVLQSSAQEGLKTYTGAFADDATYLIEVPQSWNGTLFLYSHAYAAPGVPNPAPDTGDLLTRLYLLSGGYALAGSSYASSGWDVQDALNDQIAVLDKFNQLVGHPDRTIAWGTSMGGLITAGLAQNFPERFSAGLSFCGPVAGSVGLWNEFLDSAFAFKTLLGSNLGLQVVNITDPFGNLGIAEQLLSDAQGSPQGRARIALAAALFDSSGWLDQFSPQPDPNDYATLEANQFASLQGFPFQLFFTLRAELESRAGGNPSWNTNVDHRKQLELSVDSAEVKGLYQMAGLSLDADLRALNNTARIAADPAAVSYLSQNIVMNGHLKVPVLTVHTTGDDIATVQNEEAYAAVVHKAKDDSLLRQTFVHRAGHCNFTSAEAIIAVQALLRRLDTGQWHGLAPQELNNDASNLPRVYNFQYVGAPQPSAPAFVEYTPATFQRPFDASQH